LMLIWSSGMSSSADRCLIEMSGTGLLYSQARMIAVMDRSPVCSMPSSTVATAGPPLTATRSDHQRAAGGTLSEATGAGTAGAAGGRGVTMWRATRAGRTSQVPPDHTPIARTFIGTVPPQGAPATRYSAVRSTARATLGTKYRAVAVAFW